MKNTLIDPSKFGSATFVAEFIGERRTTLLSAIKTGLVKTVTMKCGTMMVDIQSAREWSKSARKVGRPATKAGA